jgi:hypothetical protein
MDRLAAVQQVETVLQALADPLPRMLSTRRSCSPPSKPPRMATVNG